LILLPPAGAAIADAPLEELPPPSPRFQRSLKSLDGDLLEPNTTPGFEEKLDVVPRVFDACIRGVNDMVGGGVVQPTPEAGDSRGGVDAVVVEEPDALNTFVVGPAAGGAL